MKWISLLSLSLSLFLLGLARLHLTLPLHKLESAPLVQSQRQTASWFPLLAHHHLPVLCSFLVNLLPGPSLALCPSSFFFSIHTTSLFRFLLFDFCSISFDIHLFALPFLTSLSLSLSLFLFSSLLLSQILLLCKWIHLPWKGNKKHPSIQGERSNNSVQLRPDLTFRPNAASGITHATAQYVQCLSLIWLEWFIHPSHQSELNELSDSDEK